MKRLLRASASASSSCFTGCTCASRPAVAARNRAETRVLSAASNGRRRPFETAITDTGGAWPAAPRPSRTIDAIVPGGTNRLSERLPDASP